MVTRAQAVVPWHFGESHGHILQTILWVRVLSNSGAVFIMLRAHVLQPHYKRTSATSSNCSQHAHSYRFACCIIIRQERHILHSYAVGGWANAASHLFLSLLLHFDLCQSGWEQRVLTVKWSIRRKAETGYCASIEAGATSEWIALYKINREQATCPTESRLTEVGHTQHGLERTAQPQA